MTLSAAVLSVWGFAALNLIAAWALLLNRPGFAGRRTADALRLLAALPVILLALLLACGQAGGNGDTVRASIDRFQIPLSGIVAGDDAAGTARFVVADQPDGTDLIVRPYASTAQSREAMGDARHPLVELYTRRSAGRTAAWLCLHGLGPDAEHGTSGWTVIGSPGPAATALDGCAHRATLTPGTPVVVSVQLTGPTYGRGAPAVRSRFTVVQREHTIDVTLKTPLRADLGRCGENSMRLMPALPDRDDIAFLPVNDLRFAELGGGGVHPLLAPELLGDAMPAASSCAGAVTPYRWPWTAPDGEARVFGRIIHDTVPWFFLPLVILAALFLYLLRARYWRARPVEAVVVLALQWLLVLRIAIAIAGLYNAPLTYARFALFLDVAVAWLCLPILACALMMRGDADERRQVPALALFLLIALGACLLWTRSLYTLELPAMLLIAITATTLAARWRVRSAAPLPVVLVDALTVRFGAIGAWTLGVRLVLVTAAVRIALVLIGMALGAADQDLKNMKLSEHVGPVQLSMLYQPILIVGMAFLLYGFVRRPDARRAVLLAALFGLATFAVAATAHDFGAIMIYGWPIGAIVALAAFRSVRRTSLPGTLLACVPVLSPLLIFALAIVYGQGTAPDPATMPPARMMAQAIDWNDGNALRLMRWTAPDKVQRFGNSEAHKLIEQSSGMEPMARRLLGLGYLEPTNVRGNLVRYQFTDNITAIHLMAPFGRLGMVCLLLFYAALGLALTLGRPATIAADFAARMAALTLFWSGLYMALANLNLVPFTGRNVYLLAVSSGSDLLEGLFLLTITAFPWMADAAGTGREATT